MPGRRPLWAPLVEYITAAPVILYPRGGTNMIAVEHVAEAIAGAVEQGRSGERYLVGDENLSWADFLRRFTLAAGQEKSVITLPDWMVRIGLRYVRLGHTLKGRESGLDPLRFLELQTANTYFDPDPSRLALGYGKGDLDEAFAATAKASLASA